MESIKEINILVAGVGGQGNVLVSEILAEAATAEGYTIIGCEIFGAAQRGGSVVSHIRIGDDVYSPLIPASRADILVGLEPCECLRVALKYMAPNALVILNERAIPSTTVNLGEEVYPELSEIISLLERLGGNVLTINASEIAEKMGYPIAMNIIMLGALAGSGRLPIKVTTFEKVVSERFSGRVRDLNMQAFQAGYNFIRKRYAKPS